MTNLCKICMKRATEWDRGTLVEHVREAHGGELPSVEQVYPELVDELEADADDDPEPDRRPVEPAPPLDGESYGKKWYVIGVGGAGNNILDAILLRRETLRENNERRARIWEGGLAGYGLLNTNISELEGTYYAQEEQGYSRNDLLPNCIIGFGKHDYAGAGYRWDIGKRLMEVDFEGDGDPFTERWDMDKQPIKDSQAVMFVHSVTKGTGCGSTPVLAENVRDAVVEEDFVLPKPMFSAVVIPSKGSQYTEFGGRAKVNGIVGLARTSQAVDAIIPFDNRRLENVQADIRPRIDGLAAYNPPQYEELNRPLVAFLEGFTMSSVPQFLDQNATKAIKGDVFDPADSFRPVEDKYELDPDADYRPAVVLAPVLGRSRASRFDESKLEILVRNALFQNKLAAFDPRTAWGGTFLIYGPEEKMADIADYVADGTLSRILTSDDFLNAEAASGIETIDVHVKQLVTPYLEDVYLWGTLWNPEMPTLTEMYEHARTLKQEGNTQQAGNVREVWDEVEQLFTCLGRENMA